jgi:hypothetical protein
MAKTLQKTSRALFPSRPPTSSYCTYEYSVRTCSQTEQIGDGDGSVPVPGTVLLVNSTLLCISNKKPFRKSCRNSVSPLSVIAEMSISI